MRSSTFNTRTYQIYRHQQLRAKKQGHSLDYNLEDLRQMVEWLLDPRRGGGTCPYCTLVVHERNFSCDHDLPVSRGGNFLHANVVVCCRNCNEAKGPLTSQEFMRVMDTLAEFGAAIRTDVIRRLRAGGRAIHGR